MLQSNSLASIVIAVIITLTLQAACSTDMSAGDDHNINMCGSSGTLSQSMPNYSPATIMERPTGHGQKGPGKRDGTSHAAD